MLFYLLFRTENAKFCNDSMPRFPHDSEILKNRCKTQAAGGSGRHGKQCGRGEKSSEFYNKM